MRSGMRDGIVRGNRWRPFTPNLSAWQGSTPPVLGTNPARGGRYCWIKEAKLCIYDFVIGLGTSPNLGGANGYWVIELPVPAKRQMDGLGQYGGTMGPNAFDKSIGQGWASQNFGGFNGSVPLHFTVADKVQFDQSSQFDETMKWIQAFCPYAYDSGTFSMTGTAQTVTFNFTFPNAPLPAEISLQPTADLAVNGARTPWITGITTTQFTVNVGAAITAVPFSWKARSDQCVLLSGNCPFGGTVAPINTVRGHVQYETV